MADIQNALTADYGLSLGFNDDVGIFTSPNDPSVGLGEAAPLGSMLLRSTGVVYIKIGGLDTDWAPIDTSALVSTNLAALQVRRSTVFNVGAAFNDIDFDVTDIETVPSEIEHDPINRDRFLIKEAGFYKLSYNASFDISTQNEFFFRLRKNDTDIVPGSLRNIDDGNDTFDIGNDIVMFCDLNDFISMQVSSTNTTNSNIVANTMVLNIIKLRGQKGDKGDTGSGSSVIVEQDDIGILGGPHDTLNFEGGLSVIDEGSGKVTITVSSTGDMPALQVRNTANFAIPTAFTDVVFDTKDLETISTSLSHNAGSPTIVSILEDGLYEIGYNITTVGGAQVLTRVVKNSSITVAGSESQTDPSSTDEQGLYQKFIAQLIDGDTLTMQVFAAGGGVTSTSDTVFVVAKMQGTQGDVGPIGPIGPQGIQGIQGIQGPVGPAGSGSTVLVKEDGAALGSFTELNFVGSNITASDAGSGIADVTLSDQALIFGSEYQYAESLTVAVTNSTTLIQKLRLTTSNLPAGTYRLGWSWLFNHDSNGDDFLGRVQLDDITTYGEIQVEPKDSAGNFNATGSNQKYPVCGFANIVLSGLHTVDIDFATSNAVNESSIWDARLELWRVQ